MHAAWLFLCSVALANAAEPGVSVPIRIKDEETQLARRFAEREKAESPFEYAVSVGDRRDDLRWSIANGGVNIASEVEWKDARSVMLRAAAKVRLPEEWLLRGAYSTGAVRSGTNQDSDYAGSDRTQVYSRVDSKSGGAVRDLSIGLGRRFWMFGSASGSGLMIVPMVGYSVNQQNLTMYDGRQSVPANGALALLNNSYNTQWKGGWAGVDAGLAGEGGWSLHASFEYHWADYTAEGNWNLRQDLAHPVSFRHVAKGRGVLASIGAEYRLSRNVLLGVWMERQKWETWYGYDQTNFSYGATGYYTLNPVTWKSSVTSATVIYQF